MANLGDVSTLNINGNELTIKDAALTEIVNEIINAIGANNDNIAERINNLHDRSFDAEIKISSVNESEIASIVDGLYKLQYVTITGEGDNATETLNNSAILIQKGTNQYLIKDGQLLSRTKTNNTWGRWVSQITLELSSEYEMSSDSNDDLALAAGDTYEEAFGKLEKTIIDNELIAATALNDLNDKIENLPAPVKPDWNATAGSDAEILNKPTIPTVSTTITENDSNPISGGAVYSKFADLIGSAPAALDTLQEIATALNNDADLAGTLTTQISSKIPKVSNPTANNFASFNSDGTIKDSGVSASSFITSETQPDWEEDDTTSAAYIQNKPTIKDELSSEYEMSSASNHDLVLEAGDTYEEAFGKIEKTLYDNEYVISAALTDLNDKFDNIHEGDTNVIETVKVNGTALTPDANKAVNITIPESQLSSNYATSTATNEDLELASGDTYEQAFGKLEKAILDNELVVTNAITDLDERILDTESLATVAKSGSYNDLTNKPTIPSAVTESTVSGWGFTKNGGTVNSITINATSPITIDSSDAITTSGTRIISHDNSGVSAGTYKSVTVDAKGHVTGGTNPTTLSGYGITDAINTSSTAQTKAGNITANKFITSGGSSSQVVMGDGSLVASRQLPQYEAYLECGGKNFTGSYGPIDAAMVSELGAPRTMFAKAAGIVIEYSTDGGNTWVDYGATDEQKVTLFSTGQNFYTGKNTSASSISINNMLRVSLYTSAASIYTQLNKFVIYLTTQGSSGCYCTIRCRTQQNYEDNVDTWVTVAESVPVTGWSGYNVINISPITTYGNTKTTQYGELQFIFGYTGISSTGYLGLAITKILGFGGVGWTCPSNMAKTGHLYSFDANQNATFPAQVQASSFKKTGGTSSQFLKADGSVDSNTYLTSHQQLKTINNESLIGTGNITIQGGGSDSFNEINYTALDSTTTPGIYIVKKDVTFADKFEYRRDLLLVSNVDVNVNIDRITPCIYQTLITLNYSEDNAYADNTPDIVCRYLYNNGSWSDWASIITSDIFQIIIDEVAVGEYEASVSYNDILDAVNGVKEKYCVCYYNGVSLPLLFIDGGNDIAHFSNVMFQSSGNLLNVINLQIASDDSVTVEEVTTAIPSAVTESTVSGWGFTKNTGTYSKPSGGIPATDLASAVQTSLGKADTALQSYTETDPTVPSWAKQSTKPSYTASEVGALPDTYVAPVTSVNGQTGAVNLTIPGAVTESTVSGWGFTKNAGTVTGVKMNGTTNNPTNGVVDLGTVLTSFTETDPTVPSHVKNITATDISNWNNKLSTAPVTSVHGQTGAVNLTIPTVSDSTVTITMNGNTVGTFTLNKSGNTTIDLGTVLTSHQSIKTVNNQSLTGTGNISISGLPTVTSADNGKVLMVVNGAWQLVSPVNLYSGSETPSNSQGNNGDIYVQS